METMRVLHHPDGRTLGVPAVDVTAWIGRGFYLHREDMALPQTGVRCGGCGRPVEDTQPREPCPACGSRARAFERRHVSAGPLTVRAERWVRRSVGAATATRARVSLVHHPVIALSIVIGVSAVVSFVGEKEGLTGVRNIVLGTVLGTAVSFAVPASVLESARKPLVRFLRALRVRRPRQ